jgi:integrase
MKKDPQTLPAISVNEQGDSSAAQNQVWLRISAFLSMRSQNTQLTYLGIIKEWCLFLGAEAGSEKAASLLISATDMHAIGYKNWLGRRPGQTPRFSTRSGGGSALSTRLSRRKNDGLQATLSNATIWKKFAALRRIYRMLLASDLGLKGNPFDTDRVPPPPKESGRKRPTEMIDFSFVTQILSLPDSSLPKGLRDAAILAVLFGCGLRRSEVISLRLGDIKKTASGTPFLYLRSTKAGKDAEQALPPWAAESVMKLYELRKSEGALDGDYLFISYRGRAGNHPTSYPISDNGLYRMFKSYCLRAGAKGFFSPHSARATAITKLLDDGLPHRMVQEFSRHSSIQMVEVYDKRRIGIDDSPARKLKF